MEPTGKGKGSQHQNYPPPQRRNYNRRKTYGNNKAQAQGQGPSSKNGNVNVEDKKNMNHLGSGSGPSGSGSVSVVRDVDLRTNQQSTSELTSNNNPSPLTTSGPLKNLNDEVQTSTTTGTEAVNKNGRDFHHLGDGDSNMNDKLPEPEPEPISTSSNSSATTVDNNDESEECYQSANENDGNFTTGGESAERTPTFVSAHEPSFMNTMESSMTVNCSNSSTSSCKSAPPDFMDISDFKDFPPLGFGSPAAGSTPASGMTPSSAFRPGPSKLSFNTNSFADIDAPSNNVSMAEELLSFQVSDLNLDKSTEADTEEEEFIEKVTPPTELFEELKLSQNNFSGMKEETYFVGDGSNAEEPLDSNNDEIPSNEGAENILTRDPTEVRSETEHVDYTSKDEDSEPNAPPPVKRKKSATVSFDPAPATIIESPGFIDLCSSTSSNESSTIQLDDSTTGLVIDESAGTSIAIDLPKTVTKLLAPNGVEVYVVGTAHFSKESCEDVVKTIRTLRPTVVVLELCAGRRNILTMDEETILKEAATIDIGKIRSAIKTSGVIGGLLHILLLSISAEITKKLGMAPGGEFRTALKEAKQVPGCMILLGDRPFGITLSRALASLTFIQKIKLAWHYFTTDNNITASEIEACKEKDLLEQMLKDMCGEFPSISQVLIHERDTYLAHSLWVSATVMDVVNNEGDKGHGQGQTPPVKGEEGGWHPRGPIVGVVGLGHVAGIEKAWGTTSQDQLKDLLSVPSQSNTSKVIRATFRYGFYLLVGYSAYKTIGRAFPSVVNNFNDKIIAIGVAVGGNVPKNFVG